MTISGEKMENMKLNLVLNHVVKHLLLHYLPVCYGRLEMYAQQLCRTVIIHCC